LMGEVLYPTRHTHRQPTLSSRSDILRPAEDVASQYLGLVVIGDDLRSQKGPNSHNERLERSQIRLMGEVLYELKLRSIDDLRSLSSYSTSPINRI
jgi:hypothetical protein